MEDFYKEIPGYESAYLCSNTGKIKSLKTGKLLKPSIKHGYERVVLYKNGKYKTVSIHRVSAICFLENRENKKCVNHINGIRSDNRIENLEWCTHKENHNHAVSILKTIKIEKNLGVFNGEKNGNSVLKANDVLEIKRLFISGVSQSEIAIKYGVKGPTIHKIVRGKRWKHI